MLMKVDECTLNKIFIIIKILYLNGNGLMKMAYVVEGHLLSLVNVSD